MSSNTTTTDEQQPSTSSLPVGTDITPEPMTTVAASTIEVESLTPSPSTSPVAIPIATEPMVVVPSAVVPIALPLLSRAAAVCAQDSLVKFHRPELMKVYYTLLTDRTPLGRWYKFGDTGVFLGLFTNAVVALSMDPHMSESCKLALQSICSAACEWSLRYMDTCSKMVTPMDKLNIIQREIIGSTFDTAHGRMKDLESTVEFLHPTFTVPGPLGSTCNAVNDLLNTCLEVLHNCLMLTWLHLLLSTVLSFAKNNQINLTGCFGLLDANDTFTMLRLENYTLLCTGCCLHCATLVNSLIYCLGSSYGDLTGILRRTFSCKLAEVETCMMKIRQQVKLVEHPVCLQTMLHALTRTAVLPRMQITLGTPPTRLIYSMQNVGCMFIGATDITVKQQELYRYITEHPQPELALTPLYPIISAIQMVLTYPKMLAFLSEVSGESVKDVDQWLSQICEAYLLYRRQCNKQIQQ